MAVHISRVSVGIHSNMPFCHSPPIEVILYAPTSPVKEMSKGRLLPIWRPILSRYRSLLTQVKQPLSGDSVVKMSVKRDSRALSRSS